MNKIEKIISVETLKSKQGKTYYRTKALVNRDEVQGYSDLKEEYKVGDEVETFHDDKWDISKMQKPRKYIDS